MNLHELFRSFLGFPRHYDSFHEGNVFKDSSGLWDVEDSNDDEDEFHGIGSFNFGSLLMEPFHIFKQMEDMFHGLTFDDFSHNSIEHPLFGQEQIDLNPRDKMLRSSDMDRDSGHTVPVFPDWNFPSRSLPALEEPKVDIDLDDKVASGGLDEVLKKNKTFTQPHTRSFHRFVSVKTVRGPDGKIERHKTIRDGEGNEETIISKSIGDQTYSVTTRSDKEGIKEKTEDFINLDENSVNEFEKKWKQTDLHKIPKNELKPFEDGQLNDSLFHPIFSRLFGFSPRQQ